MDALSQSSSRESSRARKEGEEALLSAREEHGKALAALGARLGAAQEAAAAAAA